MSDPRTLFLALCVITTSVTASGDNWPMWRGPHGDGISQETDVPLEWSGTDNIAWKTPIRGTGYSSPIVWDDAIFLTSADLETEERLLMRIDRLSGQVEWTETVAVAPIEQMHRLNSPASGTPATDGRFVYVMFQNDDELLVKAFDFDGHEAWSRVPGSLSPGMASTPRLSLMESRS